MDKKTNLKTLYFISFLLAVSTAFPAYIRSSFIEEFVGLQWLGIFFIAAMLVSLIAILFFSGLIKKLTNYYLSIIVLIVNLISIIFLVLTSSPYLLFLSFILFTVTTVLIWINMDVFIESCSLDRTTGKTRGVYFTVLNFGWVISPLLAGYLIGNNNYRLTFIVAGLLLIPVVFTLLIKKKQLKDNCEYEHHNILYVFKKFLKNKNLKGIFFIAFLLQLFFAVMTIYVPIYLNQYLGFSWSTIGIMFTFMLLPYIFLELPAGIVADKHFREKEILIVGFLILIASCALFFFTKSTSAIVWALILFLSRCGAALIEIMRETYFFKVVDVQHIDFINFLRTSGPLSFISTMILFTLLLNFFAIQYLFIFVAIILLSGIYFAWGLKDTKQLG
ncbi:MFS transporter [Patescibacteria group bacterium]|nr:MFS transporter [Patescibacteria group bacterium]MBU4458340.1 MFS transporter [Patescibacteria group bacterium]MCG2695905.1 MFS transporter [Candidatus Portnoybacteria bacterium]